jgi:ABC-type phosphate transport system auxiliary subunit
VTIFDQIHEEIDALSERRRELWRTLGEGRDEAAAAELKELDERLAQLWDEHRALRARVRFGERDRIIARARAEERLERAA